MALIEQYLPNISDPVYSVHQSFTWILWLNWRKSTFYPVTGPNDSKCWPIVTSSIQEPVASNCDVTMTDCSRVVAMDAFLAQWCWGQWFNEFVKDTSVPSFSTLWKKSVKSWNVWQVTSWSQHSGRPRTFLALFLCLSYFYFILWHRVSTLNINGSLAKLGLTSLTK